MITDSDVIEFLRVEVEKVRAERKLPAVKIYCFATSVTSATSHGWVVLTDPSRRIPGGTGKTLAEAIANISESS